MSFQAVIFDCDGVIADSEVLANHALAQALSEAGYSLTPEEASHRFLGMSDDSVALEIAPLFEEPRQVIQRYQALFESLVKTDLRPVPGALDTLKALTSWGIPFAMASNSKRARLNSTLNITGAIRFLEGRFFGRDDVARGKPAPDLYLKASRFLEMAPQQCLVIEDSATGIHAARAAGCQVWALVHESASSQAQQAAGCHRLFKSHKDIQLALGAVIQKLFDPVN